MPSSPCIYLKALDLASLQSSSKGTRSWEKAEECFTPASAFRNSAHGKWFTAPHILVVRSMVASWMTTLVPMNHTRGGKLGPNPKSFKQTKKNVPLIGMVMEFQWVPYDIMVSDGVCICLPSLDLRHNMTIGWRMYIQLHPISSSFQSRSKGCHGILWTKLRGTTVRPNQWPLHGRGKTNRLFSRNLNKMIPSKELFINV